MKPHPDRRKPPERICQAVSLVADLFITLCAQCTTPVPEGLPAGTLAHRSGHRGACAPRRTAGTATLTRPLSGNIRTMIIKLPHALK